jgi:1-acyl-sn-glycerol-3-phosphate acyltransferase
LFNSVWFFAHLAWALLLAAFYLPWLPVEGRRLLIQKWCKQVLPILGIHVVATGDLPKPPVMLVSNHISWVDPWAINSIHPVRFVAKSEVRSYPIVGWLTQQCGVVFIERARRRDTVRVSIEGVKVLNEGDCLCVFPEGTTTDGTYILPFKSSLLQAAVDASVAIVPVALRYRSHDGSANTDVAFIGEMNLWQSLMIILAQTEIRAEITFLQPISSQGKDRQSLAALAHEQIVKQLSLPQRTAPGIPGDPAGEPQ